MLIQSADGGRLDCLCLFTALKNALMKIGVKSVVVSLAVVDLKMLARLALNSQRSICLCPPGTQLLVLKAKPPFPGSEVFMWIYVFISPGVHSIGHMIILCVDILRKVRSFSKGPQAPSSDSTIR